MTPKEQAMSNRKQSSIEWLIQKQKDIEKGVFDGFSHLSISSMYEQAKELHKQEIIDAYNKSTSQFSVDSRIDYPKTAEQYYNETYGE